MFRPCGYSYEFSLKISLDGRKTLELSLAHGSSVIIMASVSADSYLNTQTLAHASVGRRSLLSKFPHEQKLHVVIFSIDTMLRAWCELRKNGSDD